jgi:hypothetical protein
MEPIAIVKKRSRVWLLMVVLIIALILIAAALWFLGDDAVTTVSRTVGAATSSVALRAPAPQI